ncbi:MAG: hypothetical protein LKF15_01405 [Lachnospiraceae bacterium]|jgi:hypothetical protein|nr:hypothetical protein [Lachnospiraceae bacterium]MCH4027619.1 hypothetical protein [Lachnospiraceae bacterium]MCH4065459.1 hypothetical protein [Lachnospiraceae bacterium]MCH4111499.1 hypothetical protein [Lachnospiraceae bacterium]
MAKVKNIVWDTEEDGESTPQEDLGLPSEVDVPDEIAADMDAVADWLSDTYGYCVLCYA